MAGNFFDEQLAAAQEAQRQADARPRPNQPWLDTSPEAVRQRDIDREKRYEEYRDRVQEVGARVARAADDQGLGTNAPLVSHPYKTKKYPYLNGWVLTCKIAPEYDLFKDGTERRPVDDYLNIAGRVLEETGIVASIANTQTPYRWNDNPDAIAKNVLSDPANRERLWMHSEADVRFAMRLLVRFAVDNRLTIPESA